MAVVLLQEPANRPRSVSRERSLHSAHETQEHTPLDDGGRPDHTLGRRVLRVRGEVAFPHRRSRRPSPLTKPTLTAALALAGLMFLGSTAVAQTLVPPPAPVQHAAGGEASLVLPDLSQATFLGGIGGRALLMWGLIVCALGLLFGLAIYTQLKNLPVHKSMREISELIYETCKTYLLTQGKFLMILWLFIGAIVALYFGGLAHTVDAAGNVGRGFPAIKVGVILLFRFIG